MGLFQCICSHLLVVIRRSDKTIIYYNRTERGVYLKPKQLFLNTFIMYNNTCACIVLIHMNYAMIDSSKTVKKPIPILSIRYLQVVG